MADAKRIYGLVSLMLSKIRSLDSGNSGSSEDILKLQKMLSKELEK